MSEATTSSRKKYWVLTAISTAVTLLLLIFANQWFWVGLPFMLTYLVQAMDKM